MKKSYFLLFTFFFLITAAFLWGCGGGTPGMPGSQGDIGVILDATITPIYNGKNSSSVDVVQQVCDSTVTPVKYEYMADHGATLAINARLINPNSKFQPGLLTIEKYTITFQRSTESASIGAPPIESMVRYETFTITPPAGTAVSTATLSVSLVDLLRKAQYYTNVTSGQYTTSILNNYNATYTFEGQDQIGTRFSFVVQTPFQIGSFDNCV